MYSIRMIPFFTSRPISRIAPMNDETFSGVPVIQRANRALASEIGWARKMPDRQRSRSGTGIPSGGTPAPPPRSGPSAGWRTTPAAPGNSPPAPSGSPAGT